MALFSGADIQKHAYVYQVIQNILDNKKITVKINGKLEKVIIDKTPFKNWLSLSKSDIEKKLKQNSKFLPIFYIKKLNTYIKWTQIDKSPYSNIKRKGDAKTTAQQELCSLYILEQIYKNKPYTQEDLIKIYPDIINNQDWIDSFNAQAEVFKKIKLIFKPKSNLKFDRDTYNGFMSFITNLVKQFGVNHKDSWNPADIWIYTDNAIKILKNSKSLEEINRKMIQLFKNNELLGISLKKTGKTATYEMVNFDTSKKTIMPFMTGNLLLSLNGNKFKNDELNFNNEYSKKYTVNTQVRMYPKKAKSNVQVSSKLIPNAKAELGKVPSVFRNKIYKNITNENFPTGKSVPLTKSEFEKRQEEYKKKVQLIINKKIINTDIKNSSEFIKNVFYLYDNTNKLYQEIEMCTKFQGLEIAYAMSKISKKELDKLCTEWIYLAQKKGDYFGPFIKVY